MTEPTKIEPLTPDEDVTIEEFLAILRTETVLAFRVPCELLGTQNIVFPPHPSYAIILM